MHGVILGINLHDYKTDLKLGDLVVLDDGCEDYYVIEKIDPRYGKLEGDDDTPFKYFIKSRFNNELMNFSREEMSKGNIAFFDYNNYYKNNKKILLGAISLEDLNHIKGKYAMEFDIAYSEFNKIQYDDLISQEFYGDIKIKDIDINNNSKTVIKYFMVNKPE